MIAVLEIEPIGAAERSRLDPVRNPGPELPQCQRGRADGEVMKLLAQGLEGAPRTKNVEEIRGEFIAIDRALSKLDSGDLCLILVDQVEEALAHIAKRVAEA